MVNSVVYLLRHGEVDNPSGMYYGRSRDIGLSEVGMRQMDAIGRSMERRGEVPSAVIASPSYRTKLSAHLLFPDIPITIDNDLLETYAEGFDGMRLSEVSAILNGNAPTEDVFVEDREALASRVIRSVTRAREENPGGVIALVSHGDPITYALFRLLNKDMPFPPRRELKVKSFVEKGTGRRLLMDENGSVVHQEHVGGEVVRVSREMGF